MESLASKMFGTVAEGLKDMQKGIDSNVGGALNKVGDALGIEAEEQDAPGMFPVDDAPAGAKGASDLESKVSDLDSRAQTGDVTFRDFMTMSRSIAGMGDEGISALPKGLSSKQMLELREKVSQHEKIVEVMLEEELDEPELLLEDLKEGGREPGPRLQRLAKASGETEAEVGLFLMQFEAMRESTRRIADGEDPDLVNESLSAPPGANRQARRNAKKKKAKAAKAKTKM